MTGRDYLEDHAGFLFICCIFLLLQSFFLLFLGVPLSMIFTLLFFWLLLFGGYLSCSYLRKYHRMARLDRMINRLDQKYLLQEVMGKGGSREEQYYRHLLRIGNKSMLEKVSGVERNRRDYQAYVEQWVHEIKTPIAAMKLWAQNQQGSQKRELSAQLERVEHYVEQALFYARSENVEKDFCIQETQLQEVVQESLLQCKYLCTSAGMHVEVPSTSYQVYCDGKWVTFILNQLIENAVKYRKKDENDAICIYFRTIGNKVELHVRDHGIGIREEDILRIFEKGFTGENGRNADRHATGIGLFLCEKLCADLNIALTLHSQPQMGCEVVLSFPAASSYESVSTVS